MFNVALTYLSYQNIHFDINNKGDFCPYFVVAIVTEQEEDLITLFHARGSRLVLWYRRENTEGAEGNQEEEADGQEMALQ